MIDMLTNPDADFYVERVREGIHAGSVGPKDLRRLCPECGVSPLGRSEDKHRMLGPFVIIACEGYYVVDPSLVDIASPNWEPARLGPAR